MVGRKQRGACVAPPPACECSRVSACSPQSENTAGRTAGCCANPRLRLLQDTWGQLRGEDITSALSLRFVSRDPPPTRLRMFLSEGEGNVRVWMRLLIALKKIMSSL